MSDFFKKIFRQGATEEEDTSVEQRRRDVRQELADGDAVIEGATYPLHDWSASGYSVGPCDITPRIGGRIEIEFHISLPSQKLVFKTPCVTVRHVEPEKLIAGTYLDVDPDSRKVIDEHFKVLTSEEFQQEVESGIRKAARQVTEKSGQ
jgi:hypothetical protein